jgi:hypothetical protein
VFLNYLSLRGECLAIFSRKTSGAYVKYFFTDLIWSEVKDSYQKLQQKIADKEEREAYQKVVDETIRGVIHSILVMIDGGDDLADKLLLDLIERETSISLLNRTALHEEFYNYLLEIEK